MNNVKKMILVPQDSLGRMHETPSLTPQKQMNALDTEMGTILNQTYASDSEKWKLYSDALQRYLHFAGEARKPLTIEIESKPEDGDGTRDAAVRAQLAAAIPKTYKSQALRIYDYLSQSHSTVTWDSSGTISIDSTSVPHSNIIDSISDLTRARKNFAPPGTDALCHALARMNVPLELLGNTARRQLIQKLKGQRGGGVVAVSPPEPRTTRVKAKPRKPAVKKIKKYAWKQWQHR